MWHPVNKGQQNKCTAGLWGAAPPAGAAAALAQLRPSADPPTPRTGALQHAKRTAGLWAAPPPGGQVQHQQLAQRPPHNVLAAKHKQLAAHQAALRRVWTSMLW